MELKIARHLWGVDMPWEQCFEKFVAAGYSMIEAPPPAPTREGEFRALLTRHGLEYIAMAFTGGQTVREHVASFRDQLDHAIKLGARQLTVHSGSDAWSAKDADAFYSEVVRIEADAAIAVAHETHRGRYFFNPWATRDALEKFEAIRLCVDFSHWVCVAERLNFDDAAGSIVQLCGRRALHLHCRVGYEEGPQVPDPSAPEYQRHVERHLQWWETIWAIQKQQGVGITTFTPEFGPPGYLHTLPHTNVPVADLWKVCDWMKDKVTERFGKLA